MSQVITKEFVYIIIVPAYEWKERSIFKTTALGAGKHLNGGTI